MESETVAGTVATYNVGNAADAGWHYGFVALKKMEREYIVTGIRSLLV